LSFILIFKNTLPITILQFSLENSLNWEEAISMALTFSIVPELPYRKHQYSERSSAHFSRNR
jgi:hypothetical protein